MTKLKKLNNKQLDALIRAGKNTMVGLGDGLYFRIARGKPSWTVKYQFAGKRDQMSLGIAYPELSYKDAKHKAREIQAKAKAGINPRAERQIERVQLQEIRNVDQLFDDWYNTTLIKQLKHPDITKRYYDKDIKPIIGMMRVQDITPPLIREVLDRASYSGRKTIANKVLLTLKKLFNHAIKLNLIQYNSAMPFNTKDAGGSERSRTRALYPHEIQYAFEILRSNNMLFTRDNYLACCLLLCLGCRKGELISAKWEDIDFQNQLWLCTPNKRHLDSPDEKIKIPLPKLAITWLQELKFRAGGSDYVFPSRRASKRREYISDDTLNHALSKMFGKAAGPKKEPYKNMLPNIDYFTVHDLRRTFRSLLSRLGIEDKIAEQCLNHKQKGLIGIYDQNDFFIERRKALNELAEFLSPYLNEPHPTSSNVITLDSSFIPQHFGQETTLVERKPLKM